MEYDRHVARRCTKVGARAHEPRRMNCMVHPCFFFLFFFCFFFFNFNAMVLRSAILRAAGAPLKIVTTTHFQKERKTWARVCARSIMGSFRGRTRICFQLHALPNDPTTERAPSLSPQISTLPESGILIFAISLKSVYQITANSTQKLIIPLDDINNIYALCYCINLRFNYLTQYSGCAKLLGRTDKHDMPYFGHRGGRLFLLQLNL